MLVYFLIRNQNNTYVLFNLSEKNRGMNKEIGIKSIYCCVQAQFGLKKTEELVISDVKKYMINLL